MAQHGRADDKKDARCNEGKVRSFLSFFFFFCLEAGYNLGIVENKVRQGVSIYLRLSLI